MARSGKSSPASAKAIDKSSPVPPCGGCRQKLAEFGSGEVSVTMGTTAGAERHATIADLLPGAFGADHMAGA